MGFLIAMIDLHLFVKHITLHCINVQQNMSESLSYQTNKGSDFTVCYN